MPVKLEVVPPYSYGNENFEILGVGDNLARVRIAEMIGGDQEGYAILFSAAPGLVSALRAIVARISGVWDDPDLMAFGPLSATDYDVEEIAKLALTKIRRED
ncbi:MAG: hypothetical protein D4R73_09285 [Deltaproteobacteria bacterium]|nr:MAG: hypothetical protein D4R73_09285 [Deltaproteobacteria bacterium]